MRCLTIILAMLAAGCSPERLLPDRVGLGLQFDADTRELKTVTANTYWATGWGGK